MSTTTTNYSFIKPELTDPADITQFNQNWDILDAKLHKTATLDKNGKVPYEQLPSAKSWTITVPTIGWKESGTMHSVIVSAAGMNKSYNPTYGLTPSGDYTTETEEEVFALIKGLVTADGSVTLYASEVPTASITLTLLEV